MIVIRAFSKQAEPKLIANNCSIFHCNSNRLISLEATIDRVQWTGLPSHPHSHCRNFTAHYWLYVRKQRLWAGQFGGNFWNGKRIPTVVSQVKIMWAR